MEPSAQPQQSDIEKVTALIAGQDSGDQADREPTRGREKAPPAVDSDSAEGVAEHSEQARQEGDRAEPAATGDEQSNDTLPAGDGEEPEPGVTVKDLADQLGMEPKDIYEGLDIPLGDGESVTLGEWKDRVQALKAVDVERETVHQERDQYQRDLMQTRQEVSAMLQVIPEELREQVIHQAKERAGNYAQQQTQQVLEAIPDWKDPDKMAADRTAIVSMGAEYGFSEPEITYTQDARTVRMLHDFQKLREQVESLNVAAKQERGQGARKRTVNRARPGSRKLAQMISDAKGSKDARTKEAAVTALIQGQKT